MYKIKPRPIICIGIILFSLITGLLISGSIKRGAEKKVKRFESYILIYDSARFLDLKNGVFMAEGILKAKYPQTTPNLPGEYMEIEIRLEEYKSHTRVTMTQDGNGGVIPKTETYHSWDAIRSEELVSDSVMFLGRSIKLREIDFHYYLNYNDTKYDSSRKFRTTYSTYPETTKSGIMTGECVGGKLQGLKFREGKSIANEKAKVYKRIKSRPKTFLIIWLIFGLLGSMALWFIWEEEGWPK
jgi:hypothetical protein